MSLLKFKIRGVKQTQIMKFDPNLLVIVHDLLALLKHKALDAFNQLYYDYLEIGAKYR